ncbi:XVIPCD domain-containing protein [Lysobacter sp. TAB13]|uniref:XVIPCD domain-containing protein n=1 Tax=Lysobacter sp. TAB13 TaxID=3233065 RepID=UPI003F9990CE
MGTYQQSLSGGRQVELARWDDLSPPAHGEDLRQRPWNPNDSRTALAFYDSTVHYMRNDWARDNMDVLPVSAGQHNLLLYRNRETDTWHTAEALDIDHVQPWKQHLHDVGTRSMADAHQAYNDVSNLRALPAVINRARTSAERALDQGVDSPAWQDWSREHFHYDPAAPHPPFDPARDGARRTTTRDQAWTLEDGRAGLSFDTRVSGKWFEHQLSERYAGSVPINGEDGYSRQVPLFHCPATGQLVTRDAFDIDHVRPFEDVARERLERAGGSISKADALDLYNDTGNLRLVSRSANCSHEWELDARGEFRDREAPETEHDRAFVEHGPVTREDQQALDMLPGLLDRRPRPLHAVDPDAPVHQLQPRYVLSDPRNPDNGLFEQAKGHVGALNRDHGLGMNAAQLDNASAALALAAKQNRLPSIDGVTDQQPGKLFAIHGHGESMQWAGVTTAEATAKPIQQSSREASQLAANVPAPSNPQAQSQVSAMQTDSQQQVHPGRHPGQ